jgi:hypothetical protein
MLQQDRSIYAAEIDRILRPTGARVLIMIYFNRLPAARLQHATFPMLQYGAANPAA